MAFWVALLPYARAEPRHGLLRYAFGLALGALLAHLGWALLHLDHLHRHPQVLLLPGTGYTVLLVPAGPLLTALGLRGGLRSRYLHAAFCVLPAALSLSRLGCLLAACCHGIPTEVPWGMARAPEPVSRHPVALYEIAAHLLLFAALRRLPSQRVPGACLLGFGGIRLLLEPWRAVPALGLPVVPVATLAGLWAAAGGAWLLASCRLPARRSVRAPRVRPASAGRGLERSSGSCGARLAREGSRPAGAGSP